MSITNASNGGFWISGNSIYNQYQEWVMIARLDATGDTLFTRKFYERHVGGGYHEVNAIEMVGMPDGGVVFICTEIDTTGLWDLDAHVVRLDSLGNTVWDRMIEVPGRNNLAFDVLPTSDGGFLYLGTDGASFAANNDGSHVTKLDSLGNIEWERLYYLAPSNQTFLTVDAVEMPDSGFILASFSFVSDSSEVGLARIDATGNIGWTKSVNQVGVGHIGTLEKIGPNRLLIAGTEAIGMADTLGNILWRYDVDGGVPSAILNSDDFIIYCSRYQRWGGWEGLQMAKLDTLGNLKSGYLQGEVFWDLNQDCNYDTTETSFQNWIVEANPGAFTTLTDSAGFYSLQVDTGSYTIEVHPNSPYWRAQCPGSQLHSASVPLPLDTVSGLDFAIYDSITCPDLFVDISTPLVRPCSTSTYTITYSNQGSGTALDPTVELTVDTLLTVLASGIPWELPQSGNIYEFKVGTLAVGDTGTFQLLAVPDCDTNIIGRTICNRAHITPDSICTTP
ncbi:MAG: hypothetical protein AAF570_08540, partial [Bacteroidota bacterium]